ncbi:MAG: DNA-directed RNA polymerase subunit beta' [Patescibacteria group bacterium]|nr:DNA-directed RNA polymerase subunit beta' [Patescibacteria group bacterium]MCL5262115.1 DNA-directed RNA polymerase subunit beta' [Patescibacteria group bacterium]
MDDFKALKLKIASPEDVLRWSHGEVTKPETINYRTQRPEKDGLFSERIFGPTKDYECYCGKYKKIRYKGVVCDKCGVEVTRSSVRRERMGHIKLAAPVAHIWFLRSVPSRIGLALDAPVAKLEKVIYYAAYIITSVDEEARKAAMEEIEREFKSRKKLEEIDELGMAAEVAKQTLKELRPGTILSEAEFYNLSRRFGNVFQSRAGAEGVRKVLENIDIEKEIKAIEKELERTDDVSRRQRLARRLKFFIAMKRNNIRPEWMIMIELPILPPDLRPMVALDGGRYATSDLNDLYRRVINRNNRLKKLLELKAPEIIVVNEKRMLQEAVDALIDNTARMGRAQLSARRRPLRSLADMLKGKQGRFRQNLLGKRVDYSGRSVIVVGPKLKYDECGLPKKMALELFKPFVISKIIERGLAYNIKNANRLIESAPAEIWEILEEVIKNRHVLLNRAPTLHRLGIQAFKPVLIEDLAIQIPPLVCSGFNADFDGDQMAVHLPLTDEAQKESEFLMLSSRNILKPASGDPIPGPWNDIVLGVFYLTEANPEAKGAGKIFGSEEEAILAYSSDVIDLRAPIKINKGLETTCGRIIFNRVLPEEIDYVNDAVNKKAMNQLFAKILNKCGLERGKSALDAIQELGFEYATKSGITWGMSDLVVPEEKKAIIDEANAKVAVIDDQYEEGLLTESERKARVIEIWDNVKVEIEKVAKAALPKSSPVSTIIASGARGSWEQVNQMMGMRGLVKNPQGEIIDLPVTSCYKEGFSPLEYFISVHGNRKGLVDTALKTAEAGYLTRRMIDVSQSLVIKEEDCHTKEGIEIKRPEGLDFGHKFSDRLFSRTSLEEIKSGGKTLVKANDIITIEAAKAIEADPAIEVVKVRSPMTCKTLYGICSKCYGYDLGHNEPVKLGEAVGVIAAQSIGEPGTQLTLRTTHSGGVARADITSGLPRIEELFEVRVPKGKALLSEYDGVVDKIEDKGNLRSVFIKVNKKAGAKKDKIVEYQMPRNTLLLVESGQVVAKGDALSEGSIDLKELYLYKGKEAVYRYLIREAQKIYVSEGAAINNKHLEVVLRQMFSRVRISNPGDSQFVIGEVVDKSRFFEVNRDLKKAGKEPARAEELLLGIDKVALSAEGFLSAASFQETARVLVSAASEGKEDPLMGLKENVIIGRLLPIGTSFRGEFKDIEEKEELGVPTPAEEKEGII